jgi:hypothetical protein
MENFPEQRNSSVYSPALAELFVFYTLRQSNRDAAAVLLAASGGDAEAAARAVAVLGVQQLDLLVGAGTLANVAPLLMAQRRAAQLSSPDFSAKDQTNAISSLRSSAKVYAEATVPSASGQTPDPSAPQGSGFMFQLSELWRKANDVYNWPGQKLDALWQEYVAAPSKEKATQLFSKFLETEVGQYWEAMAAEGKVHLDKLVNENTPLGKLFNAINQGVIQNDTLWNTVDTAGKFGRRAVVGAIGTTLSILALAQAKGDLKTGTFNSSDPNLTPEEKQMLRGVNVPPGMNVRYFSVPMITPVTVNGKTFNVKSAATIVVAEGSNVLFLPALGPGKPGAQPWFGPTMDGGKNRDQAQLVAASSSVAAAQWNVVGFNIGTSNFNIGGRADLQFGRALLNIGAAQLYRKDPPEGEARFNFKTIFVSDLWSTFHSATLNVGPAAFVVDRGRNPQTERVSVPWVGKQDGPNVTLGKKEHPSVVQPAIPVTGASTWNPEADDVGLLKELMTFGQ